MLMTSMANAAEKPRTRNPLVMFQRGFEARFERFRAGYHGLLQMALGRRPLFVTGFLAFVALSFLLVPFLGRNFFPSVDTGQILIHVRNQVGTRVEETANRLGGHPEGDQASHPAEPD